MKRYHRAEIETKSLTIIDAITALGELVYLNNIPNNAEIVSFSRNYGLPPKTFDITVEWSEEDEQEAISS